MWSTSLLDVRKRRMDQVIRCYDRKDRSRDRLRLRLRCDRLGIL